MMHIPDTDHSSLINLVSIDPGSTKVGIADFEIDPVSGIIVRSRAHTLDASRYVSEDGWLETNFGMRQARISFIENYLLNHFNDMRPLFIVSEGSFFNPSRPNAFEVLVEVIYAIRSAVLKYDSWRSLEIIDPPTVKKSVGAPGNAKKEEVQKRVVELTDLHYEQDIKTAGLSEHAIDALAVGYGFYKSRILPSFK